MKDGIVDKTRFHVVGHILFFKERALLVEFRVVQRAHAYLTRLDHCLDLLCCRFASVTSVTFGFTRFEVLNLKELLFYR